MPPICLYPKEMRKSILLQWAILHQYFTEYCEMHNLLEACFLGIRYKFLHLQICWPRTSSCPSRERGKSAWLGNTNPFLRIYNRLKEFQQQQWQSVCVFRIFADVPQTVCSRATFDSYLHKIRSIVSRIIRPQSTAACLCCWSRNRKLVVNANKNNYGFCGWWVCAYTSLPWMSVCNLRYEWM